MRAAWFESFGGAAEVLQLGDQPKPEPAAGEVLVRIHTSGVIATYSSVQVREPQLPFMQMMYLDLTVRMIIVYAMPESARQEAIAAITESLKRYQLQHRVTHQLGLNQIGKAHELIEHGGFGGAVIVHMDEAEI